MKPKIESIAVLQKYKLFVSFSDGTKGVLDLSHLAGKGVFASWLQEDFFEQAYLHPESGAITWPGEIDIDTYNAYFQIKGIHPDDYFRKNSTHAPHF